MTIQSLRRRIGKLSISLALVGAMTSIGGLVIGNLAIATVGCLLLFAAVYAAIYARVGGF
jgi:hypothetical protein